MDKRGLQENGNDFLRNERRLLVASAQQGTTSEGSSATTPAPQSISPSDLEDYQTRLIQLEAQHQRRLLLARTQQVTILDGSSAATPAPRSNSPHPSQDNQTMLTREGDQYETLLEAARAETMEASGTSTNEIMAQRGNHTNHAGAQKRKRSNNDEGRLFQSDGVPLDTPFEEPILRNTVNLVRDRDHKQLPPHFDLIYQVSCVQGGPNRHPAPAFRDVPILTKSWPAIVQDAPTEKSHFNGNVPIFDLQAYLNDETNDTAFVVVRTIECSSTSICMAHTKAPLRSIEKIYAKSKMAKTALHKIAKCHFQSKSTPEQNSHQASTEEIRNSETSLHSMEIAPLSLFLFHHDSLLKKYIEDHPVSRDHLSGLIQFSDAQYGKEFAEAEALFEKGLVSQEHILKLYRPNDLVVGEIHGQPSALVVYDWPQVDQRNCVTLSCWSFQTDGFGFARKLTVFSIPPIEANFKDIITLVAYPLRFAGDETQETIRLNGQKQWKFRKATQVMYKGWDVKCDQHYSGARFMIDHGTYHKMHEKAATFTFHKPESVYPFDVMPVYINFKDSPSQTLLSLLSPTIHGFDLNEKRWIHLRLDSVVHPVSWNKKAFDRLAISDLPKDLVRTLVLAQNSQSGIAQGTGTARTRTGIMAGKGNGLTVLLHGGIGTGKTLTAESMAEIAEMPLYRVMCEDIRKDTDAVESDLALILHLGKAWNCVLLFEEAHFLERLPSSVSTKDNHFTGLLRILEHYNGIVVLTSSRAHALDEAVTSRIQVPLNTGNLNQTSRKKFWENFIDVFEEDGGTANFEELRVHLNDLSEMNLNGHQIRNVFKTAEELATCRYECLDWYHLVQALSLSSDFISTYGKEMIGV